MKQYFSTWKGKENIVHIGTPLIEGELQVREVVETFWEPGLFESLGIDSLSCKPIAVLYDDSEIKGYKYSEIPYCEEYLI